jgi:hypothetical protein
MNYAIAIFGTIIAWYSTLSLLQAWTELAIARGVKYCPWCEARWANDGPGCKCPTIYRSTKIYQFVAAGPVFRLIIWLWRPRA